MTHVDDVLDRLRAIIERVAGPGRTPPDVNPDTRLDEGFWLDSIEMLELVNACEEQFGIVFDEAGVLNADSLATLGTLSDLIRAGLAARA